MYKFERRGGGLKFFESTQSEYFYEIKIFFFRRMPPFLRGEVARLVLSYTLEEQLARTTSAFLAESKDIPQVKYCYSLIEPTLTTSN